MSLGWQSESALLPSKATPINVDSKSMMSMKALVYNIEKKLSNKATLNGLDGSNYSRKAPRHAKHSAVGTSSKDILLNNTKYPTIKNNSRADTDEEEANIKVAACLRAKAALYDQIAERKGGKEQQTNCPLQTSIASSGSGAFLINFDEKRKVDFQVDSIENNVWKEPRYETDEKRRDSSHDTLKVNGGNSSSSGSSSSSKKSAERYVS